MDRDVYLMLVGAGISLGSGVVTLLLQFLFGLWKERIKSKQEEKEHRVAEIRTALMDKSLPTRLPGSLLKRIEVEPDVSRKYRYWPLLNLIPARLRVPIFVGILVFATWMIVTST